MMKKSGFYVFGMLTILLALGLVACNNGTTGPALTDFITLIYQENASNNWIPVTSFSKGQAMSVGIKGNYPDKDIARFEFSVKKGGIEVFHEERNGPTLYSQDGTFTHYIGEYPTSNAAAGTDYSIDVYAVDAKGNQSNTKTATFSVTEN